MIHLDPMSRIPLSKAIKEAIKSQIKEILNPNRLAINYRICLCLKSIIA